MKIYVYTASRKNGFVLSIMELPKLIILVCVVLMSLSEGNLQQLPAEEVQEQNQPLESKSDDPSYGSFRKLNKLTNNLHQCFCYLQKPNGVPVTQMLSPKGKNIERLVVYLYKDQSSDDVKIYLPNIEKQRMIPDLAFDKGDILEMLPTNEIEFMYNKNSDLATNRTRFESPDIEPVTSAESLNHNVPNVFDIVEANKMLIFNNEEKPVLSQDIQSYNYDTDENQSEQNSNKNFNDHIIQDKEQIDDISDNAEDFSAEVNGNYDPQILDNLIQYSGEIPNTNQEFNKGLEDSNNIAEDEPNEIEFPEPEVTEVALDNGNFNLNGRPETLSIEMQDEIAGPRQNSNNLDIQPYALNNIGEDKTIKPDLKMILEPDQDGQHVVPHLEFETPETVEHHHHHHHHLTWPQTSENTITSTTNSPIDTNTITPQYIMINTLKPKVIDRVMPFPIKTSKKLLDVPMRKIVKNIPTERPNVWYNKFNQNPHIINLQPQRLVKKYREKGPKEIGEINFYDKFNNWFNQQLELVQFADSEAANSLDIYTFKHLIEKTLRKNGFYITETGLLVNSKGVEIDTANLVLRPILIGNSVEYKKLLHGKVSAFKLPKDLPYLEAVLITSINPQKILGIIPLGKTYLPKKHRNPLSMYASKEAGRGCNSCDLKKFLGSRLRYQNGSPHAGRYYSRHGPDTWTVSQNKPYLPKRQRYGVNRILSKPYQVVKPTNRYMKGSRRIFPFDQINTMIDRLYKIPLTDDKVKVISRPETYVVGYERPAVITETVPVLKYPISVTKVTPGFRIIGGNPATSSGTPVSSKGRSGLNTDDLAGIDDESITPLP